MKKMEFLISCLVLGLVSSCAHKEYVDIQSSEIKHSSPEVISLYEKENERQRREQNSGGFLSWLLDGMLGSDPDDDLYAHRHDHRDKSTKRKRHFTSKNGETLRSKLESKKQ